MLNFVFAELATAAAPDGAAPAGGGFGTIGLLIIMLAVFYFMLIRPESKRKKEAEEMRSSLKKGDWLTTIGGVYGRIVAITDRTVIIETSEDRVRLEFLKTAIGAVGTLDEQAAAANSRGRKKAKKEDEEEPAALEESTEEKAE